MRSILLLLALPLITPGEVREFPGGTVVPHDKYIRVVSESESPVEKVYIQTDDGLYVAAAVRKPRGDGPFPAFVQFHGSPGGQGMETVVRWARGETGGPMWERYLQEGFVVVAADYRGGARRNPVDGPAPEGAVTRYDDGVAVVEYVRKLPYVDGQRIVLYGGSFGGDLVLHLAGRTKVRAAGVGAPAAFWFLGVNRAEREDRSPDYWKNLKIDSESARKNVAAIQCPLLIQVGATDSLIHLARKVHDLADEAGKNVRLEIYADSPHGFYFGPLRLTKSKPLLDSTLEALDSAVSFFKEHLR